MFWTRKQQNGKFAVTESSRGPAARSQNLIIQEVDDEVLVYDEFATRAHCLSGDAAKVWRAADGTKSVEALATDLGLSEETVLVTLAELEEKNLLDEQPDEESRGGATRREFSVRVAKLGAAGAAVPMIYSVAVATPMAAATPTPQQCLFYSADSCDGCTGICGCCCCCQGCSATTVPSCKICFPTSLCNALNAGAGCGDLIPGTGQCSSGPNCSATAKPPPKCAQPCPTPANCDGHDCNCLGIGDPCGGQV